MDIYSIKTRVSNSQLAGLHLAAAVFLIIGVGAEIAVGNPVKPDGDLVERFDSAVMDPAWIAMQDVPGQELADCLSPAQVEQVGGMLQITADLVDSCDSHPAGAVETGTTQAALVTSGFVQAGFGLPRFGHLSSTTVQPSDPGVASQLLLTHPQGADVAQLAIIGNEVSIELDGLVRAHTAVPPSTGEANRVIETEIRETNHGVQFEISIDGEVVLEHTETVALRWASAGDPASAWNLQLALGANANADLPQTFSIDSISFTLPDS